MDAFSVVYQAARVLEIGVATGVLSLTLTRAKLFRPMRDWIWMRSLWWGELFSCPYCMAHWIAAGLISWEFVLEGHWNRQQAFRGCLLWLVTIAIASVTAKSIYLAIIQILPTASEVTSDKPKPIQKAA